MSQPQPTPATAWATSSPERVADVLAPTSARWWLSGGAALDRWLGETIRPRTNLDASTTARELPALIAALPDGHSVWMSGEEGEFMPWERIAADADVQRLLVHDDARGQWLLRLNVEDGSDRAWLYRRDSRLQLPWDAAVLDLDGIPTGAPEVQLVWKALRPRPEDDLDKDAVLPHLSEEKRSWWQRAILTIHPHSTWAIHVRSPLTPAKSSWNRGRAV
ncbi:hypothetical protein [Microbacterium hominis]|uniref:hypothetical protein n=1 Tax=Microbacterium hominis TaxID=162426 RepID=UPI001F0611D9|nr:hypothetical protein [Microbacterium hominis]